MSKKRRAILQLIITGCVIFCLITVYFLIYVFNLTKSYDDKSRMLGNTQISYPYFADNKDPHIEEILNSLARKDIDNIKYVVNYLGNYTNVLFKLYADELIVNYESVLFNQDGEIANIEEIITDQALLEDKMSLYIQIKGLRVSEKEMQNAKKSFLFKEYGVEIYLTNYNEKGHITLIDLNYQELENCLKFPYKLSKKYASLDKSKTTTSAKPKITADSKLVAFTFDDGPSAYTLDFLDAFDPFGAKGTFFMVGYNIKLRISIVLEVINRGHEVGNHTVDHTRLTKSKLKKEQIENKIKANNDLFYNITDQNMTLLRPPYGAINPKVQEYIENPIIMWSVDSRDWESRDAEKIVEMVLKDIKAGDIVIFHDLYEPTLEAIKTLLPILYADNYRLVTVSELFKAYNINLENGVIYKNVR